MGNEIICYPKAAARVAVRFDAETVWLTQKQMADLFGRDRSVIAKHLAKVFASGELSEASVSAFFAHTAEDGKSYQMQHYNLDAIISVGYRVNSKQGIAFRRWATGVLRDRMLAAFRVLGRKAGGNPAPASASLLYETGAAGDPVSIRAAVEAQIKRLVGLGSVEPVIAYIHKEVLNEWLAPVGADVATARRLTTEGRLECFFHNMKYYPTQGACLRMPGMMFYGSKWACDSFYDQQGCVWLIAKTSAWKTGAVMYWQDERGLGEYGIPPIWQLVFDAIHKKSVRRESRNGRGHCRRVRPSGTATRSLTMASPESESGVIDRMRRSGLYRHGDNHLKKFDKCREGRISRTKRSGKESMTSATRQKMRTIRAVTVHGRGEGRQPRDKRRPAAKTQGADLMPSPYWLATKRATSRHPGDGAVNVRGRFNLTDNKTNRAQAQKGKREMNAEGTKITGMVAVCDTPLVNTRLDYVIDLRTNRVRYVLKTHWKYQVSEKSPHGVSSEVVFAKYAGAKSVFDSIPAIAEKDAPLWKQQGEVAA